MQEIRQAKLIAKFSLLAQREKEEMQYKNEMTEEAPTGLGDSLTLDPGAEK